MMKLTEKQIKMVEDNYKYVDRFIKTRKLDYEDVHGLVSESLMKAVKGYKQELSGLYTYFSWIAKRDVASYYKSKSSKMKDRNGDTVPVVSYSEELNYQASMLTSENLVIDDYSTLDVEDISKLEGIDEDMLAIIRCASNGYYHQREISDKLNTDRATVRRKIYKIREMVGDLS